MRHVILYDTKIAWTSLLPLTYTRPASCLRLGIDSIQDKWMRALPGEYSYDTAEHLRVKYPMEALPPGTRRVYIAGNVLPSAPLAEAIKAAEALAGEQPVEVDGQVVACVTDGPWQAEDKALVSTDTYDVARWPRDIFLLNGKYLRQDMAPIPVVCTLSATNRLIGPAERLHIDPTASVEGATLNTTEGPVYIGPRAQVMEGACLRGPLAVCHDSQVRMGAKVYGDTTIGPWCKVGGEIGNVMFMGYSNKAHDGYLGNSVIGMWCNIGAGVNSSNLKNDYSLIKQWSYPDHRFMPTGLIHCGMVMGDHSRAGINTMFNTASVVGVGVSIHGSGFPRQFVASFLDGGAQGFTEVSMHGFFETARAMMARRNVELTEADRDILEAVRRISDSYK